MRFQKRQKQFGLAEVSVVNTKKYREILIFNPESTWRFLERHALKMPLPDATRFLQDVLLPEVLVNSSSL